MTISEKTLVILGATGAGKATITGCMLFQYGGINSSVMQALEELGTRDKNHRYSEATNNLKRLKLDMKFHTPKNHYITVIDAGGSRADCAVLVVPADLAESQDLTRDFSSIAKQLVVVINKMDVINWSEEHFQKVVDKLSYDMDSVPVIPISARDSDNVVEKSPNSPWYKGWKKGDQSGVTLLEALDASFQTPL